MEVKINNKKYKVPQLGFGHFVQMEEMGFVVQDMLSKNQVFSTATAFTGVVTALDKQESENLIQQHILGGGKISTIMDAFNEAAMESDFFKKMMGLDDKKVTGKKQAQKNDQTEEATEE